MCNDKASCLCALLYNIKLTNIRPAYTTLPGTNALAYFVATSETKKTFADADTSWPSPSPTEPPSRRDWALWKATNQSKISASDGFEGTYFDTEAARG
jgi:hypothetical protein